MKSENKIQKFRKKVDYGTIDEVFLYLIIGLFTFNSFVSLLLYQTLDSVWSVIEFNVVFDMFIVIGFVTLMFFSRKVYYVKIEDTEE